MKIYALGDLHLYGSQDKPMDIFGPHWLNHQLNIEQNWRAVITEDDLVLIAGDISWAMTLDEVLPDLTWIHNLPGKKVLVRGNHDYWWKKISLLNSLHENMFFLQNTAYQSQNCWIVGSRGWLCPGSNNFQTDDLKIYQREILRLTFSLQAVPKDQTHPIIAVLHYPPCNELQEDSGFTKLFEEYNVEHVVYGHLHDEKSFETTLQGVRNGVNYHLVSADYLKFRPLLLEEHHD